MCNHGISLSFKTGFSNYHSLSSESPFFFLTANNLGIYPDAEGTSLHMSLASDHDLYTVSSLYCSFIIFICLQQILFLDQNRVPSSPFHLCSKNTSVQPGQSEGGVLHSRQDETEAEHEAADRGTDILYYKQCLQPIYLLRLDVNLY